MRHEARRAGRDIIDLGMGNPDQPPPQHVIDKLCEVAAKPDAHGYSQSKGIPGLRRAQANYYARRFGVDLDPENEVVVTMGSKEGLASLATAITAPGDVVLAPNPSPDTAFSLIETERVTITAVVPPIALQWLDAVEHGSQSHRDLSSLRVLQVGGAKFAPEAARRVRPVLGCTLQQVFGMAEGLVNYTRLDDPDDIITTTQGRPISPDDEIRIVDDADRPVPDGEVGHLLTRGPYTIRGYYRADEHNATAFTADGFYRTGDLVRRTPTGHLVVEGRAKDQINRGGEKVSAEEVENHILAHPAVHDAAVVGMSDPYLGERVCAYVIARTEPPSRSELLRFLRERGLASYKIPDRVEFVDRFPVTGVGKISRSELRRELARRLDTTR